MNYSNGEGMLLTYLRHVNTKHIPESDLETLFKLFYLNLRMGSQYEHILEGISNIKEDKLHSPEIPRIIEYILKKLQASNDNIATLTMALIYTKCTHSDQRFLSTIRLWPRIATIETIDRKFKDLLMLLFKDNFDDLVSSMLETYKWSQDFVRITGILSSYFDSNSQLEFFEVLKDHVSSLNDLDLYCKTIIFGVDNGVLLHLYDLLIKFEYPISAVEVFIAKFTEIFHGAPNDSKWIYSNILSKFELYLSRITNVNSKLSGDSYSLAPLMRIFSMLVILDGTSDITKICKSISILFTKQVSSLDYHIISSLGLLCIKSKATTPRFNALRAIWHGMCILFMEAKSKALLYILQFINLDQQYYELLDQTFLPILDLRSPLIFDYGEPLLNLLLKTFDEANELGIIEMPSDLLNSSHGYLLAAVKAPFTSSMTFVVDYTSKHYQVILECLASCILLEVRKKLRTWSQVLKDFNTAAPWIIYGNTNYHRMIIPSLYSKWLTYYKVQSVYQEFVIPHSDMIIAAGISEAFFNGNFPPKGVFYKYYYNILRESADQEILDLFSNTFNSISSTRQEYIMGGTPNIINKKLDEISSHTNEGGLGYIDFLLQIYSSLERSLSSPLLTKIFKLIENASPSLPRLFMIAKQVSGLQSDNNLVSLFDMYLYKNCIDGNHIKESHFDLDKVSIFSWILTRLTAIALSNVCLNFTTHVNTSSILCWTLYGISDNELSLYMKQIIDCNMQLSSELYWKDFFNLVCNAALSLRSISMNMKDIISILKTILPTLPSIKYENNNSGENGKWKPRKFHYSPSYIKQEFAIARVIGQASRSGQSNWAWKFMEFLQKHSLIDPLVLDQILLQEGLLQYTSFNHPLYNMMLI